MNSSPMKVFIRQAFARILPAQILSLIIPSLATFLNGIIVGNFYGADKMAVLGYSTQIVFAIQIMLYLFGEGGTVVAGNHIGGGNFGKVNTVFSVSVGSLVVLGGIFTVLCVSFADPVTSLLGADCANKEFFSQASSYNIGLFISAVPTLLASCLMSFVQLKNGSKHVVISTLIITVLTITFDILFAVIFNIGIVGISLASGTANLIAAVYLFAVAFSKKANYRFSLKNLTPGLICDIVKAGSGSAILGISVLIRNSVLIHLLSQAGAEYMAGFSILATVCGPFDTIQLGILGTTKILGSIFVGEKSKTGIKEIIKLSLKTSQICGAISFVLFSLLSYPLARLYGADGVILKNTILAIISYASMSLFSYVVFTIISLHQILKRYFLTMGSHIFINIIITIPCCLLLSLTGTGSALYIALSLSALIFEIIIFLVTFILIKKQKRDKTDILLLPRDYDDKILDLSTSSENDICAISEKIHKFCLSNNIDGKKSMHCALAAEEMIGNIFYHGFTKTTVQPNVNVLVKVENDSIVMTIHDNAVEFNPESRYTLTSPDDPVKNIGIRIVYSIATEITYQRTFGLNILMIKF